MPTAALVVVVSVRTLLAIFETYQRADFGHAMLTAGDESRSRPIDVLRDALGECSDGPLTGKPHVTVEGALSNAWNELRGSDSQGMGAQKLPGRTEQLVWRTPILSFVIERHGALVGGGSTRGELQSWTVNILTAEAECYRITHRQLRPMATRLNVSMLVDRIAADIMGGRADDPAVIWLPDGRVRVMPNQINELSSGFKQTAAGRRKRFFAALDERLAKQGWTRAPVQGRYVYVRLQP